MWTFRCPTVLGGGNPGGVKSAGHDDHSTQDACRAASVLDLVSIHNLRRSVEL
jgi:hypothetical protein